MADIIEMPVKTKHEPTIEIPAKIAVIAGKYFLHLAKHAETEKGEKWCNAVVAFITEAVTQQLTRNEIDEAMELATKYEQGD